MVYSLQNISEVDGERYIAASIRPDGTVRKTIRIRAGHIMQDEIPKYQASAHRKKKNSDANSSKPNSDTNSSKMNSDANSSRTKSDSLVAAMETLQIRTGNREAKTEGISRTANCRWKRSSQTQQYRKKFDKPKKAISKEQLPNDLEGVTTPKSPN
uniref:AlNc14C90G5672 protein n=1 Tax=Albugo laibachii Nc14 TaxID=890382 RepID=F0WGE0_9STRA|nr:AlNc14C90G5672 [Albugo laibachii Nc14]|eukprot:CCA20301.1 AlNc14C90G5672 [Albugo laibachii Nc14]